MFNHIRARDAKCTMLFVLWHNFLQAVFDKKGASGVYLNMLFLFYSGFSGIYGSFHPSKLAMPFTGFEWPSHDDKFLFLDYKSSATTVH